jgi:SagB-type dehydrogenase family enzyme
MSAAAAPQRSAAETVFAYHERTKHRLERYAAGPETLDWDAQPDPFRTFAGCTRVQLPLSAGRFGAGFADLHQPGAVAPAPLSLDSLGALLQLSLGLSAWKELGPDRWALRCAPSSGNLHPTEAYVTARGVAGLDDGLYHYASRDHALELRRRDAPHAGGAAAPFLGVGLSSIHWREAWKYGERAFRYCQLDIGHALGALRYAAGVLGWSAQIAEEVSGETLATLLGLDREADFEGVEKEEPELIVALGTAGGAPQAPAQAPLGPWSGRASLLDPHPLYRWPVIGEAADATRGGRPGPERRAPIAAPLAHPARRPATEILLGRRSAQRFDRRHLMPRADFFHMLDRLTPRAGAPWDAWPGEPRLHPVIFVHGVEGLEPGVYALPRRVEAEAALRAELQADFAWRRLAEAPTHLPLFQLHAGDCRAVSRTVNCRQAIGADACFALAMLAEFEPVVAAEPWRYRHLHWEAGLLGHVLYLEAECAGLRGTGVGCFFDDALHELLGLRSRRFQALYHFTVGLPLHDARITAHPPYPALGTAP